MIWALFRVVKLPYDEIDFEGREEDWYLLERFNSETVARDACAYHNSHNTNKNKRYEVAKIG